MLVAFSFLPHTLSTAENSGLGLLCAYLNAIKQSNANDTCSYVRFSSPFLQLVKDRAPVSLLAQHNSSFFENSVCLPTSLMSRRCGPL